MAYDLSQIDIKVCANMVIQSDSTTFDRTTVRIPKINSVIRQICKGKYKDIATGIVYQWGDMIFLRAQLPYQVKEGTIIDNAWVVAWAKILGVNDTTNFSATGKILCRNNIITYTGKTPTSFTGCTGIQSDLNGWDKVSQLFTLPTDYWKPFMMKYTGQTQDTFIDFKDFRDPEQGFTNYYIIGDSTQQALYIKGDAGRYWLFYYTTVADMVADADPCILPDDYPIDVVANIVAWELLYETESGDDCVRKLGIGYSKLQMMYSEYAETTKIQRPKVQYKATKISFTNINSL